MYEIPLEIDNRQKVLIPDKDDVKSEGHHPRTKSSAKDYLRVLKSTNENTILKSM